MSLKVAHIDILNDFTYNFISPSLLKMQKRVIQKNFSPK